MSYRAGEKVKRWDGTEVKVTKQDKEQLEWFEGVVEHKCPESTQRQRAMLANQLWRNGFDLSNYQDIDVRKFGECPRVGSGLCDLLVELGAKDNRGMEPAPEGFTLEKAYEHKGFNRLRYAAFEGDEGDVLFIMCKYLFGDEYCIQDPVGNCQAKTLMAESILWRFSPRYREDMGKPMGFFEKWRVS